jgi:hypothetical protein
MHFCDFVQSVRPDDDICTEDIACGESHSTSSRIDASNTLVEVDVRAKGSGSPKQETL